MRTAMKIGIPFLLAGIALSIVLLQGAASTKTNPHPAAIKPRVKVAKVEKAKLSRQVRFSGVTRAVRRAKLSFTIAERIVERPVEVGHRVEKDQLLARLDDRPYMNTVAGAEAALKEIDARIDQIRRDRERQESLVKVNASTLVSLEKILETEKVLRALRDKAEAQLSEARRALKETVLKAPFPGTVTEVLLQPGEFVSPGVPVVILSGDDEIEVEVEIPESLIQGLSLGSRVSVDLPLAGLRDLQGTIQYLGRTALGPGRLFPVLVGLDSRSGIRPGMTAEIMIQTPIEETLCVPLSSVINPGGQSPEVFVVGQGQVKKVRIRVGEIVQDKIAVSGPLHENDMVVAGGHMALLDGDSVEVVVNADL